MAASVGTVINAAWKQTGAKTVAKSAQNVGKTVADSGKKADTAKKHWWNFSSGLDKATKSGHSWMNTAKGIIAAYTGMYAIKKVTGFLRDSVKAAISEQGALRNLNVALKNATGATTTQMNADNDWLDKQAEQTGFAKSDLIPAYQKLVQTTGSMSKAHKLLGTAMNVSAGTGKSLSVVSQGIARAYNGATVALGKYGVNMKDAKGKALSFNGAMGALNKAFAGQTAAKAKSYQGQMARLSETFGVAKVSIGNVFLPVLMSLADYATKKIIPAVNNTVRSFTNYTGEMGKLHSWLNKVGDKIQKVGKFLAAHRDTVLKIAKAVGIAVTAFLLLHKAIGLVNTVKSAASALSLASSPVGWVLLAIGAFVLAYTKIKVFRDAVNKAISAILPALKTFAGWIKNDILPALSTMAQWVVKNVFPAFAAFGKYVWSKLQPAFMAVGNVVVHKIVPALQGIWGVIQKKVIPVIQRIAPPIGKFLLFLGKLELWIQKVGIAVLGKFLPPLIHVIGWILGTALKVIGKLIGIVFDVLNAFWSVGSGVASAISAFFSAVSGGFNAVVSFITGLPGRIVSVFAGAGSWLLDAGSSLMNGLWNGIKSVASGAVSWAGGIISDIGSGIKNALNGVLHLPWKLPEFKLGAFGHYVHVGGETMFGRLASGGLVNPSGAIVQVAEGGEPESVFSMPQLNSLVSSVTGTAMKGLANMAAPSKLADFDEDDAAGITIINVMQLDGVDVMRWTTDGTAKEAARV